MMLLTTTKTIEANTITQYLGIVTDTTYVGNYGTKGLSFKDMFKADKYYENYEKCVEDSKEEDFQQLKDNAQKLQAQAVVGITVDIEMMGGNGVSMVSVVGTAVRLSSSP